MFPYTDAQTQLDMIHQRVDERRREAAAYRLSRSASPVGRHRRFGRAARSPQPVRAPAVP